MGGETQIEYRVLGSREVLRERIRELTESLGTIPGRLSGYAAQLEPLEKVDFAALRQQMRQLEGQRDALQKALFSPEEAERTRAAARVESTRQRLRSLETEDRLCREFREALRQQGKQVKEEPFPDFCPRLGGPLPEPIRDAAMDQFRKHQEERLRCIVSVEQQVCDRLEQIRQQRQEVARELRREEELCAQGEALRRELTRVNRELDRVRQELDRETVKNWLLQRQENLLQLRRGQIRELEDCRRRLREQEEKEE